MCGIVGSFSPKGFGHLDAVSTTHGMTDALTHRGPDDSGIWYDFETGIAFGHRRLAIMDLSDAGHQPMISTSGRFVLIFNGEIYNHQDLRTRIEGGENVQWRGHSDTETLLASIEAWGMEYTLKSCVGMFALALWDRNQRTLTLARDRMGEKPLYYGWQNGVLLFGSEMKALCAHPAFLAEIERDVLPLYLRHGYIPGPWSVWKGIRKLIPGSYVSFSAQQQSELPTPKSFWSFAEVVARGQASPFAGTEQEAITALEQQLAEAIAGQRLADVSLGAFLSGGIDSSTVVALMQAQSSRPVRTFTIGFEEKGYNEAEHAKAVARHLGTEHTELYVSPLQAQGIIPALPSIYDEPFGDSSAIPTYLVSQLARHQVTVSLSGDGGDELFGGYGRYFNHKAEAIWRGSRKVPALFRPVAQGMLRSPLSNLADSLLQLMMRIARRPQGMSFVAKTALIANLMNCKTDIAYYKAITSQWNPVPTLVTGNDLSYGFSESVLSKIPERVQRMMAQDTVTYLPDDILAKVDRAAMAVSLETRVPLLDHRVVELAWSMPYALKVRNGQTKWLLRQVLYRHVPQKLMERPKMGFGVPIDEWLRGPLREWADALLEPKRLEAEGYLDAKAISVRWRQHLQGHHNWRDSLWLVLMWQAWLERSSSHA